jgi:hypothetical protein
VVEAHQLKMISEREGKTIYLKEVNPGGTLRRVSPTMGR